MYLSFLTVLLPTIYTRTFYLYTHTHTSTHTHSSTSTSSTTVSETLFCVCMRLEKAAILSKWFLQHIHVIILLTDINTHTLTTLCNCMEAAQLLNISTETSERHAYSAQMTLWASLDGCRCRNSTEPKHRTPFCILSVPSKWIFSA